MSDTTNDIDALLRLWSVSDFEDHRRYHRALTALLAERDELASRCKAHEDMLRDDLSKKQKQYDESGQTIDMLHNLLGWADDGEKRIVVSVIEERDALRKRVAELEANRLADRDLRERLVCAALTAIVMAEASYADAAEGAVCYADATLAAMRKGEADGK